MPWMCCSTAGRRSRRAGRTSPPPTAADRYGYRRRWTSIHGGSLMKRSTERMLTTHVGSLARPTDLLDTMKEREHGRPYDHELFDRQVHDAVAERVRRQVESGIDIVTD